MLRTSAIAIVAALTLGGASAQQAAPHALAPEPLKYISAGDMAARLAKPQSDVRATYTIVTHQAELLAEYVTRTGLVFPEQHSHWLDSIHGSPATAPSPVAVPSRAPPRRFRANRAAARLSAASSPSPYPRAITWKFVAGVPHQMTAGQREIHLCRPEELANRALVAMARWP